MGAERRTFIVSELPPYAEEPVFSYGGKVKENKKNTKLKKAAKAVTVAYLLAVLCFSVFWFVYSFIVALYRYDAIYVIKNFIDDFFALAVCAFLIIFICSGALTKIFRKLSSKFKQAPADGFELEESEEKGAALEIKDGFEVYATHLVFFKNGERIVIDRGGVLKYYVEKLGDACLFSVISLWGEGVSVRFSRQKIKRLKNALGGTLSVEKIPVKQKRKFHIEIGEEKIGGTFASLLCFGAGGVIIALHYSVSKTIPIFLAAFFIVGGVLFFLSLLDNKELVGNFFVPLIFGATFTVFPAFICKAVADGNDIPLKWSSVHEFLSSFSGLFAAVGFLMAIGGLLVVVAVMNLVKYIKENNS